MLYKHIPDAIYHIRIFLYVPPIEDFKQKLKWVYKSTYRIKNAMTKIPKL